MRVLHVIDKSELGGGQAAVRHLLECLARIGNENHLCCRAGGPLQDAARALGIPVHSVPFDKRFRPGPAWAVARIVRENRADLVHAHGLVAAFYCVLAKRFFRLTRPILYHQHGFHHHNYGPVTIGPRKALERLVCRSVDRIIAVSRQDEQDLVKGAYAPPHRITMLHYGIPEPSSSESEIEKARIGTSLNGSPCVGLVGRLHPQKGVDVLLRAAPAIRAAVPGARFVIVGSGPLESELHALADELDLGDPVVWVGGRDAAPFLPLFHVAVISSHWEGMPLTLLEYMAAGRTIVTTDLPGCTEAVGATASVVPRNDPAALAESVIRLLKDREHAAQYQRAARERFVAEFSLERMGERVNALYREILES
jgi:glycosyltransferase involved in cell wall biosynthesis